MDKALNSSDFHGWQTPELVLDLVRRVGPIDLDPCTVPENPTKAARFYTPDSDGLKSPWGGGLAFVNPPYGRALRSWISKATDEHLTHGQDIILLTPARTDTMWFFQLVCAAKCVVFWRGRMTFRDAPAPAPFPSCLTYLGADPGRFTEVFRGHGLVWNLR